MAYGALWPRKKETRQLTISARKQGFPAQHLCEDTPDGPHVDCAGVLFEGEHDFWGAVPSVQLQDQVHNRQEKTRTYRVATYSVIKVLLSFATLGGGRAERARPKSQS